MVESAIPDAGDKTVNVQAHLTGNPLEANVVGEFTAHHTLIIIIGSLGILWLLGGVVFRKVRM